MKPSVGRTVHYRLPDLDKGQEFGEFRYEPRWRPAIITSVQPVEYRESHPPVEIYEVNLTVFFDGAADLDLSNASGRNATVPLCAHQTKIREGSDEGCWRWPPRV